MSVFFEILGSFFIVVGVIALVWIVWGKLLLPAGEIRAVIGAKGSGDGLEQTVRGLLWMQRTGLWRGIIVIVDQGMDPQGLALARKLTEYPQVELLPARHT